MDLDLVADEIYGLALKEFVAVRNQRAREASDKDLAKAISDLRKPTVAAWAVNLLVRDAPPELEQALGLSEAKLDVRELGRRRKELLEALTYRTLELTGPLAEAVLEQVRATIGAAMAEPSLAEAVREGRLTKALEYSGFGAAEVFAPVVPAGEDALARKRRERRERKLEEAAAALEEADDALREAKTIEAAAQRSYDRAVEHLDEAKRQVRAATKARTAAERKLAEIQSD